LGASALLIASGLTTRTAVGANGPGGSSFLERLAVLSIPLLATVIGAGYTWHLWNAAGKPAQADDREPVAVLSYPIPFRAFGVLAVAGGIFILPVALPYTSPERPAGILPVLGLCTLFILVGNLAHIETGKKIFIYKTGIRQRSCWGQRRLIRWEEVVELSYAALRRRFEIKSRQGEKIGFFDFLDGMPTLIRALQARLPRRIHYRALQEYRREPVIEPKNPVLSLLHDPISFDTSGMRTFKYQPLVRAWANDKLDMLRLCLFERPPELPARPTETEALRDHFGRRLASASDALISLDELYADGVPAIQMIARYPVGTGGLLYIGSFIIPFRDFSYVLRIICRTHRLTELPEGPLSWVRRVMRDIEATLRLNPAVKAQPPFAGPVHHRS